MKTKLWLTLISCVAYCIDKELYKAIDYLREQVRVLVEHQAKQNKRIILTDRQRMRIAAKAKRLSRKMLEQCTELFTADTVIRWYNKLIAEKYDGFANRGRVGRPPIVVAKFHNRTLVFSSIMKVQRATDTESVCHRSI